MSKADQPYVAILAVDGFEQAELAEPRRALQDAGVRVAIVAATRDPIQGMNHDVKADKFDVDLTFAEADPAHFCAVVLPGGVINADEIRMHPKARAFVQEVDKAGKPVAVICHGPWLLISAGLAQGHTLTSWPSLQDDLRNAGAKWVDEEVVVDRNWISSRKPDDLPAFNRELLAAVQRAPAHATA